MTDGVRVFLDGVKERQAKITAPPWGAADEHGEIVADEVNRAWCVSAETEAGEWSHDIAYLSTDYGDPVGDQERADAEFIAAAPETQARLVAAVEAVLALADEADNGKASSVIYADEIRRAVAAHLDPEKENPNG